MESNSINNAREEEEIEENSVDPVVTKACRIDVILRVLFSTLKNKDLCTAMLVCKKWNDLANEIWNCKFLYVTSKNLQILDFNRNKRVQYLCIRNGNGLDTKLLGILSTLFNLEGLSLKNEEPYNSPKEYGEVFDDGTENNICDDLYSSVFTNLQSLKIDSPVITKKQIVKILGFVCKSKKLKSLKLPYWFRRYEEIPESLFIEVLKSGLP